MGAFFQPAEWQCKATCEETVSVNTLCFGQSKFPLVPALSPASNGELFNLRVSVSATRPGAELLSARVLRKTTLSL